MDLTRKYQYLAGGHLTNPLFFITYTGIIIMDSARIELLIMALNYLKIMAGDIQNAYLNAPTKERVFFYAGYEWKSDKVRQVFIFRALYGLKNSALAWRNYL